MENGILFPTIYLIKPLNNANRDGKELSLKMLEDNLLHRKMSYLYSLLSNLEKIGD
jgi:hypothetical protein